MRNPNQSIGNTWKYNLILLFSIAVLLGSCSNQRIVDSANNRRPNWVYGIQRGFIIGYGRGTDIEEARNAAMIDVRAKIAEAVVNEIQSRKKFHTTEMFQNKAYSIVSTFLKETTATTGRGIVTKGVSISNASDYYYEVMRDRQSGSIKTTYFIKYPFSYLELNQLLEEWQSRQERLTVQKDEIAARVGHHASIEDLIGDIYLLMQIKENLVEDVGVPIEVVLSGLHNSLNTIMLNIIEEGDGYVRFMLLSNGNPIQINMQPFVRADYVNIERVFQDDQQWVVTYVENQHATKAVNQPEIHVCFQFRRWELCHSHLLDPEVQVILESPIVFQARQFSFWSTHVNVFECLLRTKVTGLGGVTLERIILNPVKVTYNYKEVMPAFSMSFEKGIRVMSGNNLHAININQRLNRHEWSLSGRDKLIVHGILFYRENISGKRLSINFSHVELKTDW